MRVIDVSVADVKVRGMRLRSEHSVVSLAQSIHAEGLHQPIVVDEGLHLIAGLHRLKAFEMLGRETIPANVRDLSETDSLLGEVSENLERNELSAIERAEHVELKTRLLAAKGLLKPPHRPPKGVLKGEKITPFPGPALVGNAEIAAEMDLSRRAVQIDKEIVRKLTEPIRRRVREMPIGRNQSELRALCKLNIFDQVGVVGLLDGGEAKTVREALRSMERQRTRLLAEDAPDPAGVPGAEPYRTVVVDPPWSGADSGDGDPFGKVAPAYSTMTLEEIGDLPVGELAEEDDCHLYLWVTGRMMHHGPRLMEGWGFRYIQPLVWVKNRIGTGRYFRNSAEFVLFGIRGSRFLAVTDQSNVFNGDRGRHSEKPESFYELVRRCSPGPRLEMFARSAHAGFDAWGAEVGGPRKTGRAAGG